MRSHDNDQLVHALVIHVAVAGADATYGAYVVAENDAFKKANHSINDAKNDHNQTN